MTATDPLLSVRDLKTYFIADEGTTRAIDGATFDVHPGRTLGIVGETGCGKSVTARSILRIVERPGKIVGGQIGRNVAVDDHAADRQIQFPQFLDGLERLLDRQRLEQGDEVDGGEVGMQHLDHAFGLRVHRAALGQLRNGSSDVEEPGDAARRRGVNHDRVVDRLLALLGARVPQSTPLAG